MKLKLGVNFINVLRTNFSYEHRFSCYVLALLKNSYEKCGHKALMKLKLDGVNFINIIRTNISYERRFSSYVLALLKNSYENRARITLMKLTLGGVNTHSHLRRHSYRNV